MSEYIVHTFDWVPELPRGLVRDLRLRWALEEAGLPYRVESVPFDDRDAAHFSRQPFGQVPWLTDGDTTVFETGAILLYLGDRSTALLPADPARRNEAVQWVFAALNSVEMAALPWVLFAFHGHTRETPGYEIFDDFLNLRLRHMEAVLANCEWLTGTFTVADLLMADVMRMVARFDGLASYTACQDYVRRATSRPGFVKAHSDQLAFFAAADAARGDTPT